MIFLANSHGLYGTFAFITHFYKGTESTDVKIVAEVQMYLSIKGIMLDRIERSETSARKEEKHV